MMRYHGNYDVRLRHVYVRGTCTNFTHLFQCLSAPVPPFDEAHRTSTILPLMFHHLGGNLSASLISCSTTRSRSSATLLYMLPILYTLCSFTQCDVLLFFSSSVRYVES